MLILASFRRVWAKRVSILTSVKGQVRLDWEIGIKHEPAHEGKCH